VPTPIAVKLLFSGKFKFHSFTNVLDRNLASRIISHDMHYIGISSSLL